MEQIDKLCSDKSYPFIIHSESPEKKQHNFFKNFRASYSNLCIKNILLSTD